MSSENFNEDVGLNIIGFKDDKYVIELEIEKRHHNTGGIVHGGVLCTMLDTAMARAFFETLPPEKKSGATLEMNINFLKPTTAGKLTAYGILTHTTKRTAFVEGHVENQEGKLVAKASATMMLSSKVET